MSQQGFVFRKGNSWFLRYRHDVSVDGVLERKQKCVKLADYCDRYRRERDLDDLAAEKMSGVRQASKCPQSGRMFTTYVEETYLPYALRTTKPSTYAGRKTAWLRYIKPRVKQYALRDITTAIVYGLLDDVARSYSVNAGSVSKIRTILFGMFKYAICIGALPDGALNPVKDVILPECATQAEPTVAATREDVQAILVALKGKPLARAAVGIMAFCGVRPGEARGMRWEEWDRAEKHIAVNRSVWHREVGTTKTEQSERFVSVNDELRAILLDLWNANGLPIRGYILAGRKDHPVILDNLAARVIRPALEEAKIEWHGWYSLRRFFGTAVRMNANGETMAKALGNSKAVAEKHYLKATAVLPDVRKAVNDAVTGLVQ
jgi:integrase